jgi:hypothetical protein
MAAGKSGRHFPTSRRMKILQLPLFLRKKFERVAKQQTIMPVAPTAKSRVMHTLPAYLAYLGSQGYSPSTTEKYFADITKFSLYLREKKIGEITTHDIEQWIAGLLSKNGEQLDPKTVNRKVSAVINYFLWLTSLQILPRIRPHRLPMPASSRHCRITSMIRKSKLSIAKQVWIPGSIC